MFGIRKNTDGYTLIELLLVIAVISIISVESFSAYIHTSKTVDFLNSYKNTVNIIRKAKMYALSSSGNDSLSDRYGVFINGSSMTLFKDNGDNDFAKDDNDEILYINGLSTPSTDNTPTYTYGDKYNMKGTNISLPITLIYGSNNGNLTIYEDDDLFDKQVAVFEFTNEDESRKRFTAILRMSGLPEEYILNPLE